MLASLLKGHKNSEKNNTIWSWIIYELTIFSKLQIFIHHILDIIMVFKNAKDCIWAVLLGSNFNPHLFSWLDHHFQKNANALHNANILLPKTEVRGVPFWHLQAACNWHRNKRRNQRIWSGKHTVLDNILNNENKKHVYGKDQHVGRIQHTYILQII